MAKQGFEKLKVWQKAHQLTLDIHKRLVPNFSLFPSHSSQRLPNFSGEGKIVA
jgi:hypothetical protein